MPFLNFETMFYNTINLEGQNLRLALSVNKRQESIIEAIFKDNKGSNMSPSQIFKCLSEKGYKYPLTSVRRAISDLTKDEILVKDTDEKKMVMGIYGKPEHTWKFNIKKPIFLQTELF